MLALSFFLLFGCADMDLGEMLMDSMKVSQAVKSGNPAECAKLDDLANECYSKMARAKNDSGLCAKVDYLYGRDLCNYELGKAKANAELCRSVSDKTLKNGCLASVAASSNDPALCGEIENDGSAQKQCRYGVILAKGDPGLCETLGAAEYPGPSDCYYEMATRKGDASICEKAGRSKNTCISAIAREKNDIGLCAKAGDDRFSCTMSIIRERKDPSLCARLAAGNEKDACYFGMAEQMGDSGLCGSIAYNATRQDCQSRLAKRGN